MKKQVFLMCAFLLIILIQSVCADTLAAEVPKITGRILDLSVQYNFLFVNLGAQHGIKQEDKLYVYNADNDTVTVIEAIKIYNDISEAKVLQSRDINLLKIGQIVVKFLEIDEEGEVIITQEEKDFEINDKNIKVFSPDFNLKRPAFVTWHNENIYVADQGANIVRVFNKYGDFTGNIGYHQPGSVVPVVFGEAPGRFKIPAKVSVDNLNNFYVVDSLNNRIQVISQLGGVLSIIEEAGRFGGGFYYPNYIDVNNDLAAVCDYGNSKVKIYDKKTGAFSYSFGDEGAGYGSFNQIHAVKFYNDYIYVANSGSGRIDKFDIRGNYLSSFGEDTLKFPRGMDIDENGNIYAADFQENAVFVFDPSGRLLYKISHRQIKNPTDVAVSPNGLYIANFGAGNILFAGKK